MSHPELVETADCLEIHSRMRGGMRVVLAAVALFPLLAPYELIIKIDWEYYMHPFFFMAAFVSAGAMVVSALFFFAAIAGLSTLIVLDRHTATLSFSSHAPVVRRTQKVYPLSEVSSTEIGVRDWSDGGPTYHLRIIMKHGTALESGSSWTRRDIEQIRERVDQFLTTTTESKP